MTVEDVVTAIEEIEAAAGDDEKQHAIEDRVLGEFVRYVAQGPKGKVFYTWSVGVQMIAGKLEEMQRLEFERWAG